MLQYISSPLGNQLVPGSVVREHMHCASNSIQSNFEEWDDHNQIIVLGAMGNKSLRSCSLSAQGRLSRCLHCALIRCDPDDCPFIGKVSRSTPPTSDLVSQLLFTSCRAVDQHQVAWLYYLFAVVFDIITTGIALFYMVRLDAKSNL